MSLGGGGRSLRSRLAAWSTALVLALGVLSGVVTHLFMRHGFEEEVRGFARHEAQELAILSGSAVDLADLEAHVQRAPGLWPEEKVIGLTVYGQDGEPVLNLGVPALEGAHLDLGSLRPEDVRFDTSAPGVVRCAYSVGDGRGWIVATAVDSSWIDAALTRFWTWFSLALGATALVTYVGSRLLLGAALRPILLLVANARDLAAGNAQRSRLSQPERYSELEELVAFLNSILAKHEENAARQAQFSAHAGHELRTPLARVRAAAEQALGDGDPETKDQALAGILEEVDGLRRLIDGLLELARSEEPDLLQAPETSLTQIAADVEPDAQVLAETAGLRLRFTPAPEELRVRGHTLLLTRTLWNLLENACKYAPPGSEVRFALGSEDGQAWVRVEDDGDSLNGQDLESLFVPFHRGRASRGPQAGLGLGLPLARAIARRHGGELRVHLREGRSCFELRLPLAAASPYPAGLHAPAEAPCR